MPAANPQENPPLDLADFRKGAREIAKARIDAIKAYENQGHELAKSEAMYQLAKNKAYLRLKSQHGATAAENMVKGEPDVIEHQIKRDIEVVKLRARLEDINGLDGERASLHRLAEWSQQL